ncbi:MAG: sulfite reductase subunit alpha [Burkholderiales bacterium]|nr:sulfite reductase subunit alpha [Phycisphaerae bacterium]
MMPVVVPVIPESAPFSPAQRAWLNGFFAGMLSGASTTVAAPVTSAEEAEEFPWHDSTLPMDERLKLASDRPPARKLMAAMAQLDCGSCGYLCQTYAEAIADGAEKDLTKCSPGGKETAKKLKELAATLTVNGKPALNPALIAVPAAAINGVISRDHPYAAPLIRSAVLNGAGSEKEVRHVEINLKGSSVAYKVGDALGVWPENCLDLVSGILERLDATGAEEAHSIDGTHTSFFEALRRERLITSPTEQLIELLISTASSKAEAESLQKMLVEQGGAPLEGLHVLDALDLAPSAKPSIADFVNSLGKLQPRLYSISSSPRAHAGQVHLTIGAVRYQSRTGRLAKGVASTYLADRVRPGEKVRVFVHESKNFGLPADNSRPIIMVGPGTGVAPFRAFLHERRAISAKSDNWLFFGDQRSGTDFLYRDELESLQKDGVLTRLDTAFSRDTSQKVYVQHRMKENGRELWKWLDRGAHFYVCGDAQRMAKDVDDTLRAVVREHAGLSDDSARDYVMRMTKEGRYQRDVY